MKLVYPALFTPLEEQSGFCVTFPDLPGCVTQGEDMRQAIEMAIDAASGWVLDELEDGNNVPPASNSKSINLKSNEFINFVVLDIDSYAEKFGNKAIRKNCTIPSWLNYQAERAGINFSQTLQEAIKQQLHIS